MRKFKDHPPIEPPWETCPECGHHQMSHKWDVDCFACIVFECPCEFPVETGEGDE